eukprot:TRINITY_DN55794_c0_g1_i1.p3 TRINITY_DN55794_c0_g1~~TRINITY_DN55794_c0_g1_i1.p3  ORF type:complete len:135 (-),score=1.88 TRINITY_DN55794_c0_g1_i1:239-643(-)
MVVTTKHNVLPKRNQNLYFFKTSYDTVLFMFCEILCFSKKSCSFSGREDFWPSNNNNKNKNYNNNIPWSLRLNMQRQVSGNFTSQIYSSKFPHQQKTQNYLNLQPVNIALQYQNLNTFQFFLVIGKSRVNQKNY